MRVPTILLSALSALSAVPAVSAAQHGGGAAARPPVTAPPREAAQFDFLVGQWEVEIRLPAQGLAQRIHGAPRLSGTWKAWRALDGWGLEDELRIVDGSGNPMTLSHAVRAYDATARRWSVSTLDVYRSRWSSAAGEWREGEMHLSGSGTGADGQAYQTRTRFHDIAPERFRMRQERSTDGGRTWEESLRIEGRRVAATAPR
jgi:hypothetical protein